MKSNLFFQKVLALLGEIYLLYLIIGSLFLFVSWMEADLRNRILIYQERGVITTATATTYTWIYKGGDSPDEYYQDFAFEAENPNTRQIKKYRHSVEIDDLDHPYQKGTLIQIVYDPTNPEMNSQTWILDRNAEQPDQVIYIIKQVLAWILLIGSLMLVPQLLHNIVRSVQHKLHGPPRPS